MNFSCQMTRVRLCALQFLFKMLIYACGFYYLTAQLPTSANNVYIDYYRTTVCLQEYLGYALTLD